MGKIFNNGQIEVEILADSTWRGHRLTTFRAKIPKYMLAQLATHRMLSKNSASSRAIPPEKMIAIVEDDPFIPARVGLKHTGMQASSYIEAGNPRYDQFLRVWQQAIDWAIRNARALAELEISKQILNRVIDNFAMINIVISATEWSNFLALRAHEDAQEEISILAYLILDALNNNSPIELKSGEWHIPFGDIFDENRLSELSQTTTIEVDEIKRRIAIARCARVSYNNFSGKDDYSLDLKLFGQLLDDRHMSPFEHVAYAMSKSEYTRFSLSTPELTWLGVCGNFRGWVQYRKTFPYDMENRTDPRLIRK